MDGPTRVAGFNPIDRGRFCSIGDTKARTQRLEDGSPVHSFRTLLGELKTLTRSRVRPPQAPAAAIFDKVSTPTPFQVRALALLGLSVQPHL